MVMVAISAFSGAVLSQAKNHTRLASIRQDRKARRSGECLIFILFGSACAPHSRMITVRTQTRREFPRRRVRGGSFCYVFMLEESAVREIHVSAITDTVAELAVAACCRLPDVMYRAIESSVEREASPSGKDVLRQLC